MNDFLWGLMCDYVNMFVLEEAIDTFFLLWTKQWHKKLLFSQVKNA